MMTEKAQKRYMKPAIQLIAQHGTNLLSASGKGEISIGEKEEGDTEEVSDSPLEVSDWLFD